MEPHYPYSAVGNRPPFLWPAGANVAIVFTVNLEAWDLVKPSSETKYGGGPGILPDPLPANLPDWPNYTWREYGHRVGFWRLLDLFDAFGVRVSATLSAQVPIRYPELFEAALERGWEFNAHGWEQGTSLIEFANDEAAERRFISDVSAAFDQSVGTPPLGWLSPSARFTSNTVKILADLGYLWHSDYLNDDEPYLLDVNGRKLVAIPYSFEVNDYLAFFRRNFTSTEWQDLLRDQLDVLLEEAQATGSGKLMNVGLHPHVSGVPFRVRPLAWFLDYARAKEGVIFPTREEIARVALNGAGA
ncbi:MAG: polysaccharide deacetylase family protein [Dehalococcoidia bacterium]